MEQLKNENLDSSETAEAAISTRVHSRKKGVVAYAKNPFWKPYEVKVGTKIVKIAGGFLTSGETGETIQHAGLHKVQYVDEDRFVKLFTQNLQTFFDLTRASQKVLRVLIATLQEHPGAQGIHLPWFTVEEFAAKEQFKISRTTFHRAMNEMLEKGFIAESEHPNFFWINPHLFFNGDRMVFISEYRKEQKQKDKEVLSNA